MKLQFQWYPHNLSGQIVMRTSMLSFDIKLFTPILYHLRKPKKGNVIKNPINYKLKVSGVRKITFINININYKLKLSVMSNGNKIVVTKC